MIDQIRHGGIVRIETWMVDQELEALGVLGIWIPEITSKDTEDLA